MRTWSCTGSRAQDVDRELRDWKSKDWRKPEEERTTAARTNDSKAAAGGRESVQGGTCIAARLGNGSLYDSGAACQLGLVKAGILTGAGLGKNKEVHGYRG